MSLMSLAGPALSIAGGLISGSKAKKAAAAAAAERRAAANSYWDSARFRPVGMTTRFGSSNYTLDENGNLTGADYNLDPEFEGMQDELIGQAGRGLGYADQVYGMGQGLFGLGSQYISQSPEQAAQSWMSSQQALLAPAREQALANVMNKNYQRGTQGLMTGATTTQGGSNPLMSSYFNALNKQDLELAAQAMEQGRNQVNFGVGLFGKGMDFQTGAYTPFTNAMKGATTLEDLGQQPFKMGLDLGQTVSNINGGARLNWANIMNGATQLQQSANSYSPLGTALQAAGGSSQFASGLSSLFASAPPVMDGGYSIGQGAAYGGSYDSGGMFTPYRRGM